MGHEEHKESCCDAHAHEHHHEHHHGDGCSCGHEHGHHHGDGCGCGHEHSGAEAHENRTMLIRLIVGAVLFATGLAAHLLHAPLYVTLPLFLLAYGVLAYDVIYNGVRGLFHGQFFGEALLMTISSIGAFVLGEYPEAVAVMLFYQLGEWLTDLALDRSQDSIRAVLDIRPDTATVLRDGREETVSPDDVAIGETILIRPGERIPLDGVILSGVSALDTRALTGESVPRTAREGDPVLSGCIALDGVLTVRTEKTFGESTASKIIRLVEEASDRKTPAERFISKFARWYTPAVVGAAVLLAVLPPLLLHESWTEWIHRALVFLVISCPCALVISIPLTVFGGLGAASREGILIKGGNYLEALHRVHTVVYDKTGTLTEGTFSVRRVLPADGFTKQDVLRLAAPAEAYSSHPIAVSIRAALDTPVPASAVSDVHTHSGRGVSAVYEGRTISVGNLRMMHELGLSPAEPDDVGTLAYVAADDTYIGCIVIADTLKPDSKAAIDGLKTLGVQRQIMLTGDAKQVGDAVANELGLDGVRSELLPDQKLAALEELDRTMPKNGVLVFVGDGINDAPVLARADVGFAMGALGSDAAIEAADAVLSADAPSKLCDAVRIAKRTHRITVENIAFALGMKALFLLLGALGIANLWIAVFGDVGVMLLAVLNAMRVFLKGHKTAS